MSSLLPRVFALLLGCVIATCACAADETHEMIDDLGYQPEAASESGPKLLGYLNSDDPQHRWRAARALGNLRYEPATDELVALLSDSDPIVQVHASIALGRIGDDSPATIDAIMEKVTSSDERVARAALQTLKELEPGPEKLAQALEHVLEQGDAAVMTHALEAIVEAGARATPLLDKALENEKSAYWAAVAIGEIGPDAAGTLPALIKVIQNTQDPLTVQQALLAVAKLGPAAYAASEAVQQAANDTSEAGVRIAACFAMGTLGDSSATELLKRLETEGGELQKIVCAWSVAKLHPDDPDAAKHAVGLLAEALKSDRQDVREAAAIGLSRLEAPSDLVAPEMMAALDGASDHARANIVAGLASLGPAVLERATGALQKPEFRDIAIEVLARLGPQAAEAAQPLANQLSGATDKQKERIHHALGAIGPAAASTASAVAEGLESDDPAVRQSALYALRQFGEEGRAAMRPVAVFFQSTDDEFEKLAGAWTLAAMHPSGRALSATARALEAGLGHSDPMARLETVVAITDLGPGAAPLVGKLREAADNDTDAAVRDAAKEAAQSLSE